MPARDQRLAENQRLFRTANERLEERVEAYGVSEAIPFLCECAAIECLGKIDLSLVDYKMVRAEANRFVILPGHAMIEGEILIADNGHYHVVEKGADES